MEDGRSEMEVEMIGDPRSVIKIRIWNLESDQ